jgi:hypothetical protein
MISISREGSTLRLGRGERAKSLREGRKTRKMTATAKRKPAPESPVSLRCCELPPLRLTREANEFMLARNDVLDGRG